MSFIRAKEIKKNGKEYTYYYLVKSYRDKKTGKVRQKMLKYLGTKKPKGYVSKAKKKTIEKKRELGTIQKLKELDREIDENIIVLKKEKINKTLEFKDLISGDIKVRVTEKLTFKTKYTKKEFVMYWAPDFMLGKVIDSRGLDIIKEF